MTPESSLSPARPPATAVLYRPAAELSRWSAGTLAGLLWLAAVVLLWRRLAGALSNPLELPVLLGAGTLIAAAAAAVRLLGFAAWSGDKPWSDLWAACSLSAAVFGIGAALSLPGAAPGGLVAFWGILVFQECWAWRSIAGLRLPPAAGAVAKRLRQVRVDPAQAVSPHSVPLPLPSGDVPADEVTQQLTRSRASDGSEALAGWLRVPMARGQRSTNVHVAFCPPFPRTPRLAVQQVDGPTARIKTVQLLPYGTRLDLKLAHRGEEAAAVLLQFSAQSKPPAEPTVESREGDAF